MCMVLFAPIARPLTPPLPLDLSFCYSGTILGIGALSDLIMAVGAKLDKKWTLQFWNYMQILVGGLLCCIFIPLITLKAIKEIEGSGIRKESLKTSKV